MREAAGDDKYWNIDTACTHHSAKALFFITNHKATLLINRLALIDLFHIHTYQVAVQHKGGFNSMFLPTTLPEITGKFHLRLQ
jgi:hypothetical protein